MSSAVQNNSTQIKCGETRLVYIMTPLEFTNSVKVIRLKKNYKSCVRKHQRKRGSKLLFKLYLLLLSLVCNQFNRNFIKHAKPTNARALKAHIQPFQHHIDARTHIHTHTDFLKIHVDRSHIPFEYKTPVLTTAHTLDDVCV